MAGNEGAGSSEVMFREITERFWVLRLITEVRRDGLYIRLEPLQRSFRHVPITRIKTVRAETYSAMRYHGWHWGLRRTMGGNTVYRLRGNRGVELVLTDGTHWFIGSQRPQEFKAAINQVALPSP